MDTTATPDLTPETASPQVVRRALRLLKATTAAARDYYRRHAATIKSRSSEYWRAHRETLNTRRRERYREARERKLAAAAATAENVAAE